MPNDRQSILMSETPTARSPSECTLPSLHLPPPWSVPFDDVIHDDDEGQTADYTMKIDTELIELVKYRGRFVRKVRHYVALVDGLMAMYGWTRQDAVERMWQFINRYPGLRPSVHFFRSTPKGTIFAAGEVVLLDFFAYHLGRPSDYDRFRKEFL